MSKTTLNWIAGVLFAFAAIADLITGPLWLAILFAVLAVISITTAVRG